MENNDCQVHKHGVGEYCISCDKPDDDGNYAISFNPNDLKEGPDNCHVGRVS